MKCKFELKNGTFKEFRLFNLLQIFQNNFENSKNQLCTIEQALQFCFKAQPQNVLDFEMGFSGQNLKAEIRVFETPNPNKTWNMIQILQGNTYNTNINSF